MPIEGVESDGRKHSLHRCRDATAFVDAFATECGSELSAVVGRFVAKEHLIAAVAVGSIPLGIGTSESDVDLLVLVDRAQSVHLPARAGNESVSFVGRAVGNQKALAVAEAVLILNRVEIDIQFLVASQVAAIASAISGESISLTANEVMLLSRLKTGWSVLRERPLQRVCGPLLRDNALEMHWTIRSLVLALGDLRDARAACHDDLALSFHLGRLCVEKCFTAYFSSLGFAWLGSKWLRFVRHAIGNGTVCATEQFRETVEKGVTLLFPTLNNDASVAASYLDEVATFALRVKQLVESDESFRIACELCPQLYLLDDHATQHNA